MNPRGTFHSADVEHLVAALATSRAKVIAIDGRLGSGKTTLADQLGDRLGHRVIHLDDFVRPRQGSYVAALDLEAFTEALSSEAQRQRTLIVEGVCVLAILDMASVAADKLIFVNYAGHIGNYDQSPDNNNNKLPFVHKGCLVRLCMRRIPGLATARMRTMWPCGSSAFLNLGLTP